MGRLAEGGMKRAFVIGDVHGHLNRLHWLLSKAGLLDDDGNRTANDVEVIQLGDLGHYGTLTKEDDLDTWRQASWWLDVVLWGNHERAIVEPEKHWFRGYEAPYAETQHLMENMRPKLAYESHGYLLTHAGVHPDWMVPGVTAELFVRAAYLMHGHMAGIVDDIAKFRGGNARQGGILWRDDREQLSRRVAQIFGHTRGNIRTYTTSDPQRPLSYCIDVGGVSDGNLAGIWLPEMKVVAVGPDAEEFERTCSED